MKKFRIFAMTALFSLGMLVPQTASAYKYYIHLPSGKTILLKAENVEQAKEAYETLVDLGVLGEDTWLSKRPNSKCIAGCD